ncbi:MAG TPA: N-acetylmuramic acid 6-phosphate etherase [Bacteroidales bacterium]|nr:MAG: N-acetylmuramic acid 6-phosphate etherase [Bacteroidetes bacterium ADurb.Bin037]HPV87853.1 N-acetylmuramic acid 6-phosphate etherase [Bacteroidales bacterium]HPW78740.1 N-acetylmuramic acid 6-phosphate etherase [Bacteroidales bacterium]HQB56243.1 N-acetylmuramic acid 6-phosphate etherase [Bacteroidales bacterium]
MIQKITEQPSRYDHLDKMTVRELLENINREDKTVPAAVTPCIPYIEKLVEGIVSRMKEGGRLFYMGAGTSGRMGILDASEIPPTFGAPYDLVIGLIAGGDGAIRRAVERAEDSFETGWEELLSYHIGTNDVVVGIAASGTTPYVIGALRNARRMGLLTACITCNPGSPVTKEAEIPIVAVVGPEFVTGSTRMKSGTAQKLILNMISTTVMIRLGHVVGNKMVDMQLSNAKLIDRGTKMIMEDTGIADYDKARSLLLQYGTVRAAVEAVKNGHHV